jgi:hypothetical protein
LLCQVGFSYSLFIGEYFFWGSTSTAATSKYMAKVNLLGDFFFIF